MQNEFQKLAKAIITEANTSYKYACNADYRLKALKTMGEELKALRESWEMLTGETITVPAFNEVMLINA